MTRSHFFLVLWHLWMRVMAPKAFVGIIAEVMAGDPDIIFIDEPEAFLHPSLQYLLGQQIAANSSSSKQVYAATHSPSFLLGCALQGRM